MGTSITMLRPVGAELYVRSEQLGKKATMRWKWMQTRQAMVNFANSICV